jgi:hypothetical protein
MFSQAQTIEKSGNQLKSEALQKKKYYDLTAKISEKTVVYPGDPEFKSENVCSLEKRISIPFMSNAFGKSYGHPH